MDSSKLPVTRVPPPMSVLHVAVMAQFSPETVADGLLHVPDVNAGLSWNFAVHPLDVSTSDLLQRWLRSEQQ